MATMVDNRLRSAARSTGILLIALLILINGGTILTPALSQSRVSALGSCQVSSLNPHSVPDGTVTGFDFTVTDSSDALAWVQITSPSANLVIVNASSDWLPNVTSDTSTATFSGSPINAGNPIALHIDGSVSSFPPSNWTVVASTDSGGSSPFACSGDTSVSVIDTTPPNITSISANASTTSATVTWQTDKLTNAEIDYGTSTAYGTTLTSSSYTTGHTFTLPNLTPNTIYHYQVSDVDQSGNSVSSVDGTFRTAALPTTSTTQPQSGGTTTTPVNVKVTTPSDTVPPTISLTSTTPAIVRSTPTFTGIASDDLAVARVEYSTDNGKDWLPAENATGLNSKHVTFSFTPANLSDGTYAIVARAVDGGGNVAQTAALQVVIDTEPPVMGGMALAFGSQLLTPNAQGVITTLPGMDLNATFSSAGGVTSATLQAANLNNPTSIAANFTLRYADETGLWSGTLSFTKPGSYHLDVKATDGAGNTSTRTVATITVAGAGNVLSSNGPLHNALLTVYYLDPDSGDWTVWDGHPYGQANPQLTDTHGAYRLLLPAGTYYVHAEAEGYQSVNSEQFTYTRPTPFTSTLHLSRSISIGSLQLPWVNLAVASATSNHAKGGQTITGQPESLIGTSLPGFTLDSTDGTSENNISWLGRPTVVCLLNSWSPGTAAELPELEKLAANADLNVKTIGVQENAPRLRALSTIAGSNIVWLADPTGQTATTLKAGSVPTYYFVDRKGVIRSIDYGTVSYDAMLTTLMDM